jgi:transcriptional regulator with XRE-family HTH domain
MIRTPTDSDWEAQLHKEAYSAAVKSALRTPGTKQDFAERVGISPQYLSYLLNPDDPRTPGPEVAQKIADALPLDPEQRADVFEHLLMSRQRRVSLKRLQQEGSSTPPLEVQVARLGHDHHLAATSTEAGQSRPRLLAVRNTGKALLQWIDPHVAPLSIIQICFILHDTQCLLNRPDDALYYAKLARWLVARLNQSLYRAQREYIDQLEFHAIRAECVAYHGLKLPKQAYASCEEAATARGVRERPDKWKPHLLRDTLNALSRTTRFSLRAAEELAQEVQTISQRRAGEDGFTLDFLMQRSLGMAYHTHGNHAKARRVFEGLFNNLHAIPQLGPVPKTLFLNSYARLLLEQGHRSEWEELLRQAIDMADNSGITQTFVKMRQSYGPTMGPLLKEMRLIPTLEDSGAGG